MRIMEETVRRLYDKELKNLLSYPSFVAPILHYCIDELKEIPIPEIIEGIEKVPNTKERIQKLDGEMFTLKRRVPLRADSIFQIKVADQRYKVDLEPQMEEPRNYSIFDRQEMYSAILLTDQEEDGRRYQNYMPVYSIWLIFAENLPESRIGRTKQTIEWYNGEKYSTEARKSLMNGVFVYVGKDARKKGGLFSYLYGLFQSADSKYRYKELERYGIEDRKEVKEMDQVYWDIFNLSVRMEAKRIAKEMVEEIAEEKAKEMAEEIAEEKAKEMAEEIAEEKAEQLAQELAEQKEKEAKEAKLQGAVRMINQILATNQMPFDQIFSIITSDFSEEEKESIFQSIKGE